MSSCLIVMQIRQSLKKATQKLQKSNIPNPHLEAEILLSHILKKPREFVLAHPEKGLTKSLVTSYKLQVTRRLKGEPIAYITGHKQFYGLDFQVNKNVLIPRPETELMVEEALRITPNAKRVTIIDVGTGNGCIIISLLKQLVKSKLPVTNYQFLATDISKPALALARKNAKLHNVHKKIKFLPGNLLQPIIKKINKLTIENLSRAKPRDRKSEIIITANLPYGWSAWKNNCSMETIGLKFEPQISLFTGKNGLELYEKLFKQLKTLRVMCYVLCEIDPRQTILMKKLIKKYLPCAKIQIKKDLSGLNRLAIIKINNSHVPHS